LLKSFYMRIWNKFIFFFFRLYKREWRTKNTEWASIFHRAFSLLRKSVTSRQRRIRFPAAAGAGAIRYEIRRSSCLSPGS